MKALKAIFSFAMFGVLMSLAADALKSVAHPALTAIVLITLAFASYAQPKNQNIHIAAVQQEFWVDYIVKRFWKDNTWMKSFYSDDQYVIGGKTVHIPQPGAKPTIQKNPTSFPLTATQRTDTEVSYDLDWYVTNPTHITDAEKQEISYDKMDSVLGDHLGVLNERIAEEHLIKALSLLPGATNVIYTTGALAAGYTTGQTGNRRVLLPADLKLAGTKLNLQNVPKEGRFAILDSNALDQLTTGMDATQWNAFNQHFNAATGVLGKLYGITIYERSDVAIAKAALSGGNLDVPAFGTAVAATDINVNLVWHKEAITRAMGQVKFFEDIDTPMYAGSVYNAGIRFGGRRRKSDSVGVIAIGQASA